MSGSLLSSKSREAVDADEKYGDAKTLRRFWLRTRRVVFNPAVILVIIVSLLLFRRFLDSEKVYSSSPPRQPLVMSLSNFMSEDIFHELHEKLPNHPLIKRNNLDQDNFKHTTGWLVKFNREGMVRFRTTKEFQLVLPYIDAVLDRKSNAFVMNLLIASPPPEHKDAVGTHVDNTIGIKPPEWSLREEDFLAHQVNVLYTNVPKGIKGGELCVWPNEFEDSELHKAILQPIENTMVEFRGDAYHMVRNFETPHGEPRISLVLEQYRIPKHLYHRTVEFCQDHECYDDDDDDE